MVNSIRRQRKNAFLLSKTVEASDKNVFKLSRQIQFLWAEKFSYQNQTNLRRSTRLTIDNIQQRKLHARGLSFESQSSWHFSLNLSVWPFLMLLVLIKNKNIGFWIGIIMTKGNKKELSHWIQTCDLCVCNLMIYHWAELPLPKNLQKFENRFYSIFCRCR